MTIRKDHYSENIFEQLKAMKRRVDRLERRTGSVGGRGQMGAARHSRLAGLAEDDHLHYVHLDGARTITAQHTFAPAAVQPPFLLSANAQDQVVVGLRADQVNRTLTAGTGLTGGGLLTADRQLDVDETYAFSWSALHVFGIGLRITAGQTLQFGTDAALERVAAGAVGPATGDVLQSQGYSVGRTGWKLEASDHAEMNSAEVRAEMHASVLTVGENHAVGGTVTLSAASVLWEEVTTLD